MKCGCREYYKPLTTQILTNGFSSTETERDKDLHCSPSESDRSTRQPRSSSESIRMTSGACELLPRPRFGFMNSWASWTIPSNLTLVSAHADLAKLRVALPQATSLKLVWHMDSLPVERVKVLGRLTVLPLAARTMVTVNVPVATRVSARSTYITKVSRVMDDNGCYIPLRQPVPKRHLLWGVVFRDHECRGPFLSPQQP